MENHKIEYVVPNSTQVIFVSDFFVEDYTGGAELTMEALTEASPFRVFKLHSKSLTPDLVSKNTDKYWILVNFTGASKEGLIEIATTCRYSVVECDYKYCMYRSPQLHTLRGEPPCSCQTSQNGKFIYGLMKRAQYVFFMSYTHMHTYWNVFSNMKTWETCYPQLSTWSPKHLDTLELLSCQRTPNGKWAILGGGSWIKNQAKTEEYAKSNHIHYDVIGGLSYDDFIRTLSNYSGLIFHPAGMDTCPRIVVEAKILGLDLDLNDFVQHKDEAWFKHSSPSMLASFLRKGPLNFWKTLGLPV